MKKLSMPNDILNQLEKIKKEKGWWSDRFNHSTILDRKVIIVDNMPTKYWEKFIALPIQITSNDRYPGSSSIIFLNKQNNIPTGDCISFDDVGSQHLSKMLGVAPSDAISRRYSGCNPENVVAIVNDVGKQLSISEDIIETTIWRILLNKKEHHNGSYYIISGYPNMDPITCAWYAVAKYFIVNLNIIKGLSTVKGFCDSDVSDYQYRMVQDGKVVYSEERSEIGTSYVTAPDWLTNAASKLKEQYAGSGALVRITRYDPSLGENNYGYSVFMRNSRKPYYKTDVQQLCKTPGGVEPKVVIEELVGFHPSISLKYINVI